MTELARACPSCSAEIPPNARSCPSCGALSLVAPPTGFAADEMRVRVARALGQRYRVERELGRGGMAVVFLAQDLRHNRRVAIKVLHPELAPFLGDERFLREISIAAQLTHPHIVPLHDSGEAEGLLYYVMPFIEGDSLRQRLRRDQALPIAEAVRMAREVADGLAFAHELGIVHRDIKPENILLAHGNAMIADFGIARVAYATRVELAHTTGGIFLGTPQYMSPEQSAPGDTLDHRTDIYSLGCTLFEALTGSSPYAGPDATSFIAQHVGAPIPSVHALRTEVPRALNAAVRRAMAKNPADRFQSAAEFSEALAPFAVPHSTTVGVRILPPTPRRWRLVGAAVAVSLLAMAGTARLLARRHAATPAPAAQRPLVVVVRASRGSDEGLQGTANMQAQTLTDRLVRVPALSVVSSDLVADLSAAPLDSVVARLKPDRVVTVRVDATSADSVRLTVQVVDPQTRAVLSDGYVDVPSRIRSSPWVADSLSLKVRRALWAEMDRDQRRARVRDADAWSLVVRAGEYVTSGAFDFRSLQLADSCLDAARRLDGASNLIPVEQARIAERRAFMVEVLAQNQRSLSRELPRPVAERNRALGILDELIRGRGAAADAYQLRGEVRQGLYRSLHADTLLDDAIVDFRSATELDLHRASAWMALAAAQREAGLYKDAVASVQRAEEEDVFQLYRAELLRTRFDAALRDGQFSVALQACRTGMTEMPSDRPRFADCELELWSKSGADAQKASRARARADSLAATAGPYGVTFNLRRELFVAEILALAGQPDSADALAFRATANPPAGSRSLLDQELVYLHLIRGDTATAMRLSASVVRANPAIRRTFEKAVWFKPLRSALARDRPSLP